jgi:hypothetical protein
MKSLEQKKADRFKLLNALYEITDGDRSHIVEEGDLAGYVSVSTEQALAALDYLKAEGLIQQVTGMGGMVITHEGVIEVEKALSKPEEPTHYFPPVVNIMNVHTMVNSQIQQGSHGSTQHVEFTQNDIAAIRELMTSFQAALQSAALGTDAKAEAEAEVATVQAQLASPKPKRQIIMEGIKSICSVLESVASSTIAKEWLPRLLPLLAKLAI